MAYQNRLRRILTAQGALERLGVSRTKAKIWTADALSIKAWPRGVNVILCSPPYGLGIDYVRASRMHGAAIDPEFSSAPKEHMLGRVCGQVEPIYPLPNHIRHALWAKRSGKLQPHRFTALLQYLVEVESLLVQARDRLPSDAVLGMVLGDPEMTRSRVPLTRMVHQIAIAVGFSDIVPPRRDTIRRRFQATTRRDSDGPITHETLLCLTPN